MNGVAECRPPLRRRENAVGYRLKRVTRGYLRAAPLVDVHPDALNGRDAGVGARGFEGVEAEAIDRLERQLVLKTRLGAGVELPRHRDPALPIQVRAVALKTQGPGSSNLAPIRPNDIGLAGPTRGFLLQSRPAGSTQRLRASAFQLSARKANPLILCELTVFLCHGSQFNRCL